MNTEWKKDGQDIVVIDHRTDTKFRISAYGDGTTLLCVSAPRRKTLVPVARFVSRAHAMATVMEETKVPAATRPAAVPRTKRNLDARDPGATRLSA